MPRVNGTKKPDPDAVYVAWQGAALPDPDITLPKGSRLKGDHPAVRNNSWLFVEDGALDEDAPHELDHAIALGEAAQAALPDRDLRVTALPIPIEAEIVEAATGTAFWGTIDTADANIPLGKYAWDRIRG